MDVPLARYTPAIHLAYRVEPTPPVPGGASISIRADDPARRWRAYAPRAIVVESDRGVTLLEVEEMTARQSLAVRSLRSYASTQRGKLTDSLSFDFAGGGEVLPNWSISLFEQGISRPEVSRGALQPGAQRLRRVGDPATGASLVSEAQYLTTILDNRNVGDASARRATRSATTRSGGSSSPPPPMSISAPSSGRSPRCLLTEGVLLRSAASLAYPAGCREHHRDRARARALGQRTQLATPIASGLAAASGRKQPPPSRAATISSPRARRSSVRSRRPPTGTVAPGATCALNAAGRRSPPPCRHAEGSTPTARCPTVADPIVIEQLPWPGTRARSC